MGTLVKKTFSREYTRTFNEAIRREWVITNGLGGYAGSSLIGANTRKHHGLLIACLKSPTDRWVILNGIKEEVIIGEQKEPLYSEQKTKGKYVNGFVHQTGFSFDAVPEFTYFYKGLSVKKTVALEWEKNTVAIGYEINNGGDDCVLSFVPVFNYRDANASSTKKSLKFKSYALFDSILLEPKSERGDIIRFFASAGTLGFNDPDKQYDEGIELQTEIDTGMSSSDTGYCPYNVQIGIKAGESKRLSFVCTIESDCERDAFVTIKKARERAKKLLDRAGFKDEFLKRLTVNADNFICNRESTGTKTVLAGLPWFADWGRDTMIALTGITLETGRFEDAQSILETFARYEKNGLIPNMFPDGDKAPLYNTVDASLWYFYCTDMYLKYVGTKEAYEFVREKIYPCFKNIIAAYKKGTDFSIGMDADGLIHAGSGLDQVTWMDVRIGDLVVTPRHGKPVEINALWYNALVTQAELAKRFGDKEYASELTKLSKTVKASFVKRFWYAEGGYLYDVVDEVHEGEAYKTDSESIRPNQIYAISLPHTMLDREKEKSVVNVVLKNLYVDFGLRTLPEDDPYYHGVYAGKLYDRDLAYHQGTAWAFPLGAFIEAYLKVNDYSKAAKEYAATLLEPMKKHLDDGCIGGIAEIFDGDAPHISRGCYTQAWSVGEILRAYALLTK